MRQLRTLAVRREPDLPRPPNELAEALLRRPAAPMRGTYVREMMAMWRLTAVPHAAPRPAAPRT